MSSFKTLLFIVFLAGGVMHSAETPPANLQLIMLTQVNPQALAVWEVTNNAMNDEGELDPKLIAATQWEQLLEYGKAMEKGANALVSSKRIISAASGVKIQDENNQGASTAADVQRYLDAKPAEFRKYAVELQKTGAAIVQAATRRDVSALNEVASNLDMVCENCHAGFWYPQERN